MGPDGDSYAAALRALFELGPRPAPRWPSRAARRARRPGGPARGSRYDGAATRAGSSCDRTQAGPLRLGTRPSALAVAHPARSPSGCATRLGGRARGDQHPRRSVRRTGRRARRRGVRLALRERWSATRSTWRAFLQGPAHRARTPAVARRHPAARGPARRAGRPRRQGARRAAGRSVVAPGRRGGAPAGRARLGLQSSRSEQRRHPIGKVTSGGWTRGSWPLAAAQAGPDRRSTRCSTRCRCCRARQGALAVECRRRCGRTTASWAGPAHEPGQRYTLAAVTANARLLAALEAGCSARSARSPMLFPTSTPTATRDRLSLGRCSAPPTAPCCGRRPPQICTTRDCRSGTRPELLECGPRRRHRIAGPPAPEMKFRMNRAPSAPQAGRVRGQWPGDPAS